MMNVLRLLLNVQGNHFVICYFVPTVKANLSLFNSTLLCQSIVGLLEADSISSYSCKDLNGLLITPSKLSGTIVLAFGLNLQVNFFRS